MASHERIQNPSALIAEHLGPLFNGLQDMLLQTKPLPSGHRAAVAYDPDTGYAMFAVTKDEGSTRIAFYPVAFPPSPKPNDLTPTKPVDLALAVKYLDQADHHDTGPYAVSYGPGRARQYSTPLCLTVQRDQESGGWRTSGQQPDLHLVLGSLCPSSVITNPESDERRIIYTPMDISLFVPVMPIPAEDH